MADWRTKHKGRPLKPENQYIGEFSDEKPRGWISAGEGVMVKTMSKDDDKDVGESFRDDQLGSVDMRGAVEWVFQFMDHGQITAADAPNAGAWSLMLWVRGGGAAARSEFYKTFASKLMPTKSQVDGGAGKLTDDGRAQIALAERMAKEMGDE